MKQKPALRRYPHRKNEVLQAWDAADDLLVAHAATLGLSGKRVLVLNDSFGAIARGLLDAGLEPGSITSYTDSFVAAKALELNNAGRLKAVSRLDELQGPFDLALARVPKYLSFFEDELSRLSQGLLARGAPLVCGVMVKHQSAGAFDLLNRLIGETRTSLAEKKARLIFCELARDARPTPAPLEVRLDGFDKPFTNPSNLFSREKLDIGTRFLLENLPEEEKFVDVLDLGCANGVVGIAYRLANPEARVVFADDSRQAVESARENYARQVGDERARFEWTNCYEDGASGSLDLVLCNPPFHQGTTVGDHVARQMFNDARRALRPGGLLRVIGNAHLRYGDALKRLFGNATTTAKNAKFTIIDARASGATDSRA